MHTYLGTLKKGFSFDHTIQSDLESKNIKIVKNLKALNILIIQSEEEVDPKDHPYFEGLEKERTDFSI